MPWGLRKSLHCTVSPYCRRRTSHSKTVTCSVYITSFHCSYKLIWQTPEKKMQEFLAVFFFASKKLKDVTETMNIDIRCYLMTMICT
jgi:hypothetical protein